MPIPDSDSVLMVTRFGMGNAEPELMLKILGTYLRLVDENNILPAAICFYTDGVKLAVTGSPVLGTLRSLEVKGVHLILCNTCLNHFKLIDEVQVGIVGGMPDIIEAQRLAAKVITL